MRFHATALLLGVFVLVPLAGAQTTSVPRTLFETKTPIIGFTEDTGHVAWIAQPRRGCARLHIRTLLTGKAANPRKCVGDSYGEMAMANGRVLWKARGGFGNTEGTVDVLSASVRDPHVRYLASLDMERDPVNGIELADPPLAGRGRTLVFYYLCNLDYLDCNRSLVYKVVGRRLHRLFSVDEPTALATDAGRVVTAEQGVRRGDGCGCSFSPVWLPDGRIEFLAGRWTYDPFEGDWPVELAVINADGAGRRMLTADGRARQTLDVSNDGKKVAYEYVPKNEFEPVIAVANQDGTGATDVAHGEAPSLSPDGARLAFNTFGGDEIHIVNADGSGDRVLAAGSSPVWSPDGARIAYDNADDEAPRLSTIDPDGSHAHTLPSGDVYSKASWSPDSRRLAFPSERGLMAIDADGSHLTRLTSASAWSLSWSPDGTKIAFASSSNDLTPGGPTTEVELYVMNADGSSPHPITYTVPNEYTTKATLHTPTGKKARELAADGAPGGVALKGHTAAVIVRLAATDTKRIEIFDLRTGASRGVVPVPHAADATLLAAGRWLVYSAARTIFLVDPVAMTTRVLARAAASPIGLSVAGRRVAWGENRAGKGRVRAILVPP